MKTSVASSWHFISTYFSESLREQSESRVSCLTTLPLAFQKLIELQYQDYELAEAIAKLEKGESVSKYSLSKGVLYCRASARCRPQIVVPRVIVPTLFEWFHTYSVRGHVGVFKTIKKIR